MSEVSAPFEPKTHLRTRLRAEAKSGPPRRYPARIARQLALAHALQSRVVSGEFCDYAAMARSLGFTRARITQMMDLLLLAPDIQEEVLFLMVPPGGPQISERALRSLTRRTLWSEQRQGWVQLRSKHISRA